MKKVWMIAAAALLLCGCAEKAKPESIDTGNFSREIQVESTGDRLEIGSGTYIFVPLCGEGFQW